jgi:eukaryotic-like serine/threonine-protein kinase
MSEDLAALSRKLGDRYLIERELGRGGMGAVYLARDRALDRPVALKVLPPEFAAVPELRERFLRETRLAAGFSHPNIVPVFAIEDTDGLLAFAMGFVEGESVAARVARDGPLSRRDAVRLLQDVSYALAYAHGRGVVHRDIKPDNIMIERATGRALVMDFGIARAITPVSDRPGLTRVGEVVGTPEYMSPEQASGDAVDGRSDLYSLGLVAWFAMTGRTAVTGESTQRVLVKQLTEAIPPLASIRGDLPSALCDVVDRCCAKEPAERFPTAEAVVEALDATQLATPDIPVAIRLLAPELNSVGTRIVIAIGLLAYGTYRIVARAQGNIISLGIVVAAAAWIGAVSVVQEIRRLCRSGYTPDELQRLLTLIQSERDEVRALRRTDSILVKRRRRRVYLASGILVWQGTTFFLLLRKAIANGDAALQSRVSVVSFFGGLLAIALATTILLSSPFRRSLNERLFSAIWLSPLGRVIMNLASGGKASGTRAHRPPPGVSRPATATAHEAPARATTPVSLMALANDVATLRARIEALESRTP